MGRKLVITEFNAIESGDMSSDVVGTESDCQFVDHFQYIVSWTGTSPVGQIVIEQSTDGKVWTALDFGGTIGVSGNTGDHTIIVQRVTFKYCRISYLSSSGLGVINAKYSASTVGA